MDNPHEAVKFLYDHATLGVERAASLVSQRLSEADQLEAKVKELEEQVSQVEPESKPAKRRKA